MGATGPFKLYNLQLKKKLVISCGQRGIEAPTTHTVSEQQQQQHVFLRKSLASAPGPSQCPSDM